MKNNNSVKVNFNVGTILLVVFLTLKLSGVINWSWVWVLSPLWIGAIIAILVLLLALVATSIKKREEDDFWGV